MALTHEWLVDALKSVYNTNLVIKNTEKALVFTDTIGPDESLDAKTRARRDGLLLVARAAGDVGVSLGIDVRYCEYISLGGHGKEPPESLWRMAFGDAAVDALKDKALLDALREKRATAADVERARAIVAGHAADAVDVVIALSNYSTSHTRFRDLLTSVIGARYASMPQFEADMLTGAMTADWAALEKRCSAVSRAMAGGESVRITTPIGTDIKFSVKGRTAAEDTGMLKERGAFSNLPAGEVYLAPVEGTANGVLVVEWAPMRKLASPIRVTVRGGVVCEVEGDEPYVDTLINALDAHPNNRNIAELGIGTNEKASRPDNILESEKILGTIHIAFGDNSSMGGTVSAPFHQDFVFFRPTLVVTTGQGERTVLKDGRLLA